MLLSNHDLVRHIKSHHITSHHITKRQSCRDIVLLTTGVAVSRHLCARHMAKHLMFREPSLLITEWLPFVRNVLIGRRVDRTGKKKLRNRRATPE